MKKLLAILFVCLVQPAFFVQPAFGESIDIPPPAPGVTLPAGALQLTLTFEANLSKDAVFEPFSIAPDVAYGLTSDLTLQLVHSTVAVTGVRGIAGSGLCLAGEEDGCPDVYRNVGLEGIYSLLRGSFAAGAVLGLHLNPVSDPTVLFIKLGARMRTVVSPVIITFNPSVLIAANERDRTGVNDSLFLPFSFGVMPIPILTLGMFTGTRITDLGHSGDTWGIPLGFFETLKLAPPLVLGASFVFSTVAGGEAVNDGFENRALQVWLVYTR